MTKEIICINVGQAGVQMGSAAWELFCVEHGLDVSGFPRVDADENADTQQTGIHTFFHETNKARFVPRAINIDLEPTVIDEIRTGAYKHLWHPSTLLNSTEDAANNFARGRYSIGKKMLSLFFNQLLKQVRDCQRLHGFIMMNSLGGGTGSGFSSLILDKIDIDFTKYTKISTVIYPSPQLSTAIVEPYNSVLSTTTTIDLTDVVLLCDNEAMYDICLDKLFIPHPVYNNLNRIISQLFSSLTVTFRFGASMDHDLVHLQTNLVPFPRIHFPFANYAPLTRQAVSDHDTLTTQQLTRELFEPSNQLLKCDISRGKYMACCVQYRGLVVPRDVHLALMEIKHRKDVDFVDWCPTGFKVGLSPMPPGSVANSHLSTSILNVAMFSNSTAIEQSWDRLIQKFDLLYHKHAFIHWFVGEGMEEAELQQSRKDIKDIQADYQQLGQDSDAGVENKESSNSYVKKSTYDTKTKTELNISLSVQQTMPRTFSNNSASMPPLMSGYMPNYPNYTYSPVFV